MDKENVVHVYSGILFTHKEKESLAFVTTWMNREDITQSEIKPDTERQILIDLTYMWNLKKSKTHGSRK